jgi:hypothetical protein
VAASDSRTIIAGSLSNCTALVSINPAGSHNHPTRDVRALAPGWLSLLLALEVAPAGRAPQIETELRVLIRLMSVENPLWGAPRIHGELLKLGFEIAQSSVAKYMVKRRRPPSQGWRTFLRNHAPDVAAMDLFVVPNIGFDLLYAFVIVRLDQAAYASRRSTDVEAARSQPQAATST